MFVRNFTAGPPHEVKAPHTPLQFLTAFPREALLHSVKNAGVTALLRTRFQILRSLTDTSER